MSPRTIVIFSELRSVSFGRASGLGWTASPENVREQAAETRNPTTSAPNPLMEPGWPIGPVSSIATGSAVPGEHAVSTTCGAEVVRSGAADELSRVRLRVCVPGDHLRVLAQRVRQVGAIGRPVASGQVDRLQHPVG